MVGAWTKETDVSAAPLGLLTPPAYLPPKKYIFWGWRAGDVKEAKWRSREKELDRGTMAWTWKYLYLGALWCLTITELKLATYTNIPLTKALISK